MSTPLLRLGDGFSRQRPHLRPEVQRLQQMLKRLGHRLDADGFFGQGRTRPCWPISAAAGCSRTAW